MRGMFLLELKCCDSSFRNEKYKTKKQKNKKTKKRKERKERVKIITRIYVTFLHLADIDYCQSSPCKNNSTCHSLSDDYRCDCLAGFTGKNCAGLSRFFTNVKGVVDTFPQCFNICLKENTKRRGGFLKNFLVKYNADFLVKIIFSMKNRSEDKI